MSEEVRAFRRNAWAVASFVLGLIGFLVALTAPIPFIPILSAFTWPLGLGAMVTGWVARRQAQMADDRSAAGTARWGVGLGCLGWTIQFITSTVKVLILAGLLAALFSSLFNSTPTPTP